jgi:hypothetical protein
VSTATREDLSDNPLPARGFRFRLSTFLIAQAAITGVVALGVAAPESLFAGIIYVAISTALFFGTRGMCRLARYESRPSRSGIGVLIVAVGFELYAAHLAYYTIGEIASGGLYILILLNIPAVVLLALGLRWLPIGLIAALALFIVPEQLQLLHKWNRCDEEAHSVIAYVEAFKKRTGAYPDDLSEYRFVYPDLRSEFHYDKDVMWSATTALPYQVRYHVGSENTSHDYSPTRGWFYYPD